MFDKISNAVQSAQDLIKEGAEAIGVDVQLDDEGVSDIEIPDSREMGEAVRELTQSITDFVAGPPVLGDEVSGADSSESSASESTGLGDADYDGKTVDEMNELMKQDPDALMEHLEGMDDEKRQMAMQAMQQRMQQLNQMFSMMSNLMQARHDTAKAAINNMRV